jgi:hypothetical protein
MRMLYPISVLVERKWRLGYGNAFDQLGDWH